MEQQTTSLVTVPVTLPSPVDFDAYLRAVNDIPMLSHDRETDLVQAWRNNQDRDAARELVLSHLRLVTKVVKDHRGYGLPEGDLVQEGTVGLMRAVKGFDPSHGVRLASYALKWIEAEIREYIFKSWRLVRLGGGATMKKLFFGYRKTVDSLRKWSPDRPIGIGSADVAKVMGVSSEDAAVALSYFSGKDLSLAIPDDGEDGASHSLLLGEVSAASVADNDPARITEDENDGVMGRRALAIAWDTLDHRSQGVLSDRRLSDPPLPLREVAEKWSVSIERIRQIEQSAWTKWVDLAKKIVDSPPASHDA
jgi:RNA polymerase sigma-32 factor